MNLNEKSSTDEIRRRFDTDVERFSHLETGQAATIDAPLVMELITQAAVAATPVINRCLDIGCGAGNNAIKLLREYPGEFDCDLCDLSESMLQKAEERLSVETSGAIRTFHGDFRDVRLPEHGYDVILAAAVRRLSHRPGRPGVPAKCVHVHRERRFPTVSHLPVGSSKKSRIPENRNSSQELLLCRVWSGHRSVDNRLKNSWFSRPSGH